MKKNKKIIHTKEPARIYIYVRVDLSAEEADIVKAAASAEDRSLKNWCKRAVIKQSFKTLADMEKEKRG